MSIVLHIQAAGAQLPGLADVAWLGASLAGTGYRLTAALAHPTQLGRNQGGQAPVLPCPLLSLVHDLQDAYDARLPDLKLKGIHLHDAGQVSHKQPEVQMYGRCEA